MIKYIIYLFGLLILTSCNFDGITSNDSMNNSEDNISYSDIRNDLNNSNIYHSHFNYDIKPFSSFTYLGNDPYRAEWPRYDSNFELIDGAQGLANDGQNWFLTTNEKIYKWSSSYGFTTNFPSYSTSVGMPDPIKNYDHYGDADFDENLLYVPLEVSHRSLPPRLVVFDANLNFVDSHILSKNAQSQYRKEAPWITVNPISKKIYTSKYRDVNEVWIYEDEDHSNNLDLNYIGSIQLKKNNGSQLTLQKIQGGEFSKSGHLFLYAQNGPNGKGIYVIDEQTGKLLNYEYVKYESNRGQEFEGITVWDHDNSSISTPYGGQVHAMVYQKHAWWGNYYWLKHFRLEPSTEGPIPIITDSGIRYGKPYLEWADIGSNYSYEVEEIHYQEGFTSYSTSSNTMSFPRFQLEYFPSGNIPQNYIKAVEYSVRSKRNGYKSSKSKTVSFYYECDTNAIFNSPCLGFYR